MRILRKHSAILIRPDTNGYYDENGDWHQNLEISDGEIVGEKIPCCIQPEYDGELQKDLPEGVRAKDCKFIYTEVLLQGASESKSTQADILKFIGNERYGDGETAEDYEVFEVQRWLGAGRIDAWMVLAIRRDKIPNRRQ